MPSERSYVIVARSFDEQTKCAAPSGIALAFACSLAFHLARPFTGGGLFMPACERGGAVLCLGRSGPSALGVAFGFELGKHTVADFFR
jgi:hypothetical protein